MIRRLALFAALFWGQTASADVMRMAVTTSFDSSGLAVMLEDWLTGPRAAELINTYRVNGETLFIFNATTQ